VSDAPVESKEQLRRRKDDVAPEARDAPALQGPEQPPGEIHGPKGPEPTRFGDWEKNGRCTDF
jgi:hypothetical protein